MEVRDICKSYNGRLVLDHVSFTIPTGITILWAPSGAGKTTLLRILMGLERPDSGTLTGTDVRWAAVFQEDRLLEHQDAAGNLRFALGADYDAASAATMLAALGLDDRSGTAIRDYSGGMKRRLALARALLVKSDAIALDEPFTGLDGENRQRALQAIRHAAESKPVLLVTHDRSDLNAPGASIINL